MRPTIWLAIILTSVSLGGCTDRTGADVKTSSTAEGEVRAFDIYVTQQHIYEPYEGKRILGFAFGLSPEGPFSIPGPEIRVREGDTIRATFHASGDPHTIHWHGIKLPWAMDGVPFMTQTVAPGEHTYVYEFTLQESGTYWYHCHVDAPGHIDAGMFGPLIVEPRDAAQDPPFDREYTLMLHETESSRHAVPAAREGETPNVPPNPFDAAEAAQGMARSAYDIGTAFVLPDDVGHRLGGQGPREHYPLPSPRYRPLYDTFMINGKSYPETEPVYITSGETIRIRLVNAGALVHTMHLHGTHFLVTHKDGYILPAAYRADTLLIGPGERYDIYVEGDNPGIWDFHDHGGGWSVGAYAANDYAFPGGMNTMLVYEDFEYARLPQPTSGRAWTSGDYVVFAPSYAASRGSGSGSDVGLGSPESEPESPPPEASPSSAHAHPGGLAGEVPDAMGAVEGTAPSLEHEVLDDVLT